MVETNHTHTILVTAFICCMLIKQRFSLCFMLRTIYFVFIFIHILLFLPTISYVPCELLLANMHHIIAMFARILMNYVTCVCTLQRYLVIDQTTKSNAFDLLIQRCAVMFAVRNLSRTSCVAWKT
jgi:hypothetical protein